MIAKEKAEFSLFNVFFRFKEAGHIGDIFKEGGSHKRFLTIQAWDLGNLIDEIKKTGWDIDNFTTHNLEKLT